MTLNVLNGPDKGNESDATLLNAVKELQGLNVSVVTGAAAGTKMDIAALRTEDTLLNVVVHLDAGGALVDDTANCTIQATKASGTLTVSGNPVDGETFVVGANTYTFKTTPTAIGHVKITLGDNNTMAAAVSSAINSVENKRVGVGNQAVPNVVATVASNVVTVTSTTDGVGNAPVLTSSDGTDLAVTGSTTASATITAAAVDNDDNFTLMGITFTAKASPTGDQQFLTINGNNTNQATEIARVINAYQNKYGTLGVSATAAAAVVTIVPIGVLKGNITPLTEAVTNFTVSGATLTGGTATGGFKSTTNLTGYSAMVFWFNKS